MRILGRIGPVAAAAIMAAAVTAAPATAQSTASCYASAGHLYCGNAANAPIYAAPSYTGPGGNPTRVVDHLLTTQSYFKCYVYGAPHGGGNSVWYYTYGDVTHAWGYVAAVNVYTSTDPFPGVSRC
ncbi:MAG: hypothetical protein HOY71_11355 [Nonomuraea sp.]|nr:hypothetical protein [Nonomuraea sp.]